jgi:hypothetical protein
MMINNEKDLTPAARIITVPRFEAKHIFYLVLCLAGAAAALYFFWRDLNMTLVRFQDEPLGTVTRKQNTVQRRFEDRTLWDRLRRQSLVYSGDYIRTAELSGASLLLTGGEILEIEAHTLIQIIETPEGLLVELSQGALQSEAGSEGLTVRAAGASLRVEAGSLFSVSAGEGGLEAAVMAGNALFQGREETRPLKQGEAVGRSQARAAVLSPRPGTVFLNTSDGPLALSFILNRLGFAPQEALRLEIAGDRFFTRILLSFESLAQSLPVELENGVYYWRAYPAGQGSPPEGGVSGRLSIIDAPPPELISPAADEEFSFSTTRPDLRFLWTSCEEAGSYHLEVSANPDMTNPFYQSHVQDSGGDLSSIAPGGFESGTWYWRVRPEYPRGYEGTAQASRIGSFRIGRAESLAAPLQYLPPRQGSLYLEDEKGEAYFSWKQEKDAASYTFLLSQREDLSDPLIEQQVQDNYFAYDLKEGSLVPGQYYWGVYQTDSDGVDSDLSVVRSVVLIAGPPPETRTAAAEPAPPSGEGPAAAGRGAPPEPSPGTRTAAAEPAPPESQPEILPLPAPGNMRPASGYILSEDIVIRERQISFSWDAVPGASAYVFILYHVENDLRREVFRHTQSETLFTLRDLSILDVGTFIWRVEPRSRIPEQESRGGENVFTVSIEETQSSWGQESGVLFGN